MFQKILLGIVLFFALSIVSFFLIIKVIDFNEYKPKIQKIIKENTGYEFIIRGDISLSLYPIGVSLSDVEVFNPSYNNEIPFAKLGNFDVALEIAPLFKKEIKVRHIALENLTFLAEKTKEGKFNFEILSSKPIVEKKPHDINETKENKFPLIDVKKIKFGNANIDYVDSISGHKISFEKVNLSINDIHFDATKTKLQALLFKADATVDAIKYGKYMVRDINMVFEMKDATANVENIKYTIFDSVMQGSGKIDLSGNLPRVSIKHKIVNLKLANLSKELMRMELLEGVANGDLKLSCSLGDVNTTKSTLNGFVQLFAENVQLKGYNIDKLLSTFDESEKELANSHLISFFTGVLQSSKNENSVLNQVNTKFDIGYSEVKLSDVAFSTTKHRVAFKGALQIIEEKILDVKMGLLDAKGCAVFEQTMVGTFSKPTIKLDDMALNTIKNVALSLVGKVKGIQTPPPKPQEENCTPFYEGSIKHPIME